MPYTLGDHLIRPVMTATSGLPQDEFVNDWSFKFLAGAPTIADLTLLIGIVGDFYRLGAAAIDRVGNFIGGAVNRGATHTIQAYRIQAGPLGSPVLELPWLGPVAAGNPSNMPTEVAGVLSFHADLTGVLEEVGVTRPKARRRGRVYIGPLNDAAIDQALPFPTLTANFTAAMRSNAVVMSDAAEAIGWEWSVWSRADQQLRPVIGGWTDNAPDTQRRRGQEATGRTVFGPVGP